MNQSTKNLLHQKKDPFKSPTGGRITKCKVVEPKSFAQSIAEMGFPVVIEYEPNSHEVNNSGVRYAWRITFDVAWSNSDGLSYSDTVKGLLNEALKLHGVPGVQLHEWAKAQWRGTSLPFAQEIALIREATAMAVRSILDGYTLHCAFERTAKERGGM